MILFYGTLALHLNIMIMFSQQDTHTSNAPLKKGESLQIFVGILLILSIALIAWLHRPNLQTSSNQTIMLQASFPFVDGITKNAEVLMMGIRVGFVDSIAFVDEASQSATLGIAIDHPDILSGKLLIPDDSNIRIVTPSIFKPKVLWIEPGASFDSLQNGDSFLFAQGSFVIDDFLRMIMTR